MTNKSTLTEKKRKKRFGIFFSMITAWLMFFNISNGLAVTLTCNIPELSLSGLKIGGTYKIEEASKINLTYTNGEGELINVAVKPLNSGFPPKTGYELLPNVDWVDPITPNSFTIAGSGKQQVSVSINVPQDIQYLGKKFEFLIWGYTTTGPTRVGTFSDVTFSVASQFIGYGVTGYDALTQIHLVGNKAIIRINIASLQAATVKLSYRVKGTTKWNEKLPLDNRTVTKSDGTKDYYFEISASDVTTAGLEYYIQSVAGTDYAYSPESTIDATHPASVFNGTPYEISVDRVTTGRISATGTTLTVIDGNPDDGEVQIVAPKGAVSQDINVTMEQIDVNSSALPPAPKFSLSDKPAMVFNFAPSPTTFNKNLNLTLLYLDLNNDGYVDGLVDADGNPTIAATSLKMFFWDGFNWRLVSGPQTLDPVKHTITAKTNHFSYYALFPVAALSPEDYRPAKKIITPNSDGTNDEADFNGLTEEIKIFDITGRKIRSIAAGVSQWDGKDDDGSIVEIGVYIYQFKVEGTLVSGVIAVAK